MLDTSAVGEWVVRAGRLKQAGAYHIDLPELVAIHAAFFPDAAPVRITCRACIIAAYQAVLRYLRTNTSPDSSPSISTTMSKNVARFASDDTQYFPFGLGVVYSNENLTDSVARQILKDDPDAERLFKTLPAEEVAKEVEPITEDSTDVEPATEATVVLSERLHRDELEAIYADEVKEGDPKAFANKADLIAAIEANRAAQTTK